MYSAALERTVAYGKIVSLHAEAMGKEREEQGEDRRENKIPY